MTTTGQTRRLDITVVVDAPACSGHAGLARPADDNDRPTEIIEIGSLGTASPPIA